MGNAEDNYLYHTIQPKETLYSLSVRYKVPDPDIIAANPGLSVSSFTIGKTIRIPATPIETLPTTDIKTVTKGNRIYDRQERNDVPHLPEIQCIQCRAAPAGNPPN